MGNYFALGPCTQELYWISDISVGYYHIGGAAQPAASNKFPIISESTKEMSGRKGRVVRMKSPSSSLSQSAGGGGETSSRFCY